MRPFLTLTAAVLALTACGDPPGPDNPEDFTDVVSVLGIEITDQTVTPVATLHGDTFTVSFENNYIDLREGAISVSIDRAQVSTIEWTSPDNIDLLYYVIFPADPLTGRTDIRGARFTVHLTSPISISSIALFRLDAASQRDSVMLSLKINDELVFENRLFILEDIRLTQAVAFQVPLLKQGQRVTIRYSSQDYCLNANPGFRDPRNIHSVFILMDSWFCGLNATNFGEFSLVAFFTSLPVED